MKWNQYRLKTTTQAEDIISSMLAELGVEGVQIEDRVALSESDKEKMFVDILPDIPEDDGTAYLTFYLDSEEDNKALLEEIKKELEEMKEFLDLGECVIEESQTEDIDWINNWKQYFHQFYIDDILVIPSWEKAGEEDSDKMIVHIDPGTAFGTGMHETTQLCIRALKRYVEKDALVLDVGCGSGILGIAAAKLGAEKCYLTDIDPVAVESAAHNAALNRVQDRLTVALANLLDDSEIKGDLVLANIMAEVLALLAPSIPKNLKAGGTLILSGIIGERLEFVKRTYLQQGLRTVETRRKGEWYALALQREGE